MLIELQLALQCMCELFQGISTLLSTEVPWTEQYAVKEAKGNGPFVQRETGRTLQENTRGAQFSDTEIFLLEIEIY